MAGFPEPLIISSNKTEQCSHNIESKINSLEIKILSLENTIMKLINKMEHTNSSRKKRSTSRSLSRSRSRNNKTIKKMLENLKKGPYGPMKGRK